MVMESPVSPQVPMDPHIEALRIGLHGSLLTPDSAGYDEARKVFNAMIDRRPALIVQCADTSDVVLAVNYAREHNLVLSVRGGGHSVAGHSVCEAGLMIDFSLMKSVDVDVENRIATAQPGLTLGEFIVETEKFGFVSPTGTNSGTGLAGLTLGGGYGWLSGKYGMAVDNLVGAEIVTADGSVLQVSETENADLLWALRGGSGNFGVVTAFRMKLYPITQVLGGMVLHPFSKAREVLQFYRGIAENAPDELTTYAALMTGPDGQKMVAIALCYCGDMEEGQRIVAPVREFGPPVADMIRPMPYSEMNSIIDEANPRGMQHYWKWNGIRSLSDGCIEAIVDHVERVPSPRSVILIDQLHGAASRVDPTATAFAHRDAPHGLVIVSMWEDPADSEPNIAWARSLNQATRDYATGGVYVNVNLDEGTRAAFGVNFDRLVELKRKYDPTNFFRHNMNIKPD